MASDHHDKPGPEHTCEWRFRVDRERFDSAAPLITGREILVRAGKTPVERFLLILSGHGQPREIALDESVDLSVPGIEQFRTIPRECREGLAGRRHFRLPEKVEAFLDATGYEWEAVTDGGAMRLVMYGYKLCAGFNHSNVDVYMRIEPTYPDTQIDMVYVHPPLALNSGRAINALANESFDGKMWQRWSRHRVTSTDWRPGIDGVETHMALVNSWFANEVTRNG